MNRDTILIVDDMEVNRAILHGLFEEEFNLLEAENGEQASMLISQYQTSLAAVLLDLVMPVKDGYGVLAEMEKNRLTAHIPVIVITSEDSAENEVRAFDLGATDIILKPFAPHVVRRRVQNAIELNRHKTQLEEMVEEQAAKLRESRDVIMDTLSSIIEHRSAETGQHVLRIRMFTKVLLEEVLRCCPEYELTERAVSVIAEAAALHDIGKISIPDTILNKPGRLTPEEFDIMKTHTVNGCDILSGLDRMGDEEYLRYAYNICRYHHERWDGNGYPEGLKGDNTPICAQAVGIADAYDALTTDRVYKKAYTPQRAMTMILNNECGVFSPKLLECLKNVREPFFALTREYADGHSPKSDMLRQPAPALAHSKIEQNLELGQMKYFAMLRYSNATVMEIDLDSGIYHLVYQQSEDFQALRSGGTLEESIRAFAEHSVHPDDRALVLDLPDHYVEDFFQSGLIKRTRRYRVLHRSTGDYVWYEAATMRVDMEHPNCHRALILWRKQEQKPESEHTAPLPERSDVSLTQTLPVSMQRCLVDQWFTLTYLNDGFTTLFGYSAQEMQTNFQSRFLSIVHPDDRQSMRRQFTRQLSTGNTQELEYRVITKDGRTVWVLDQCQVLPGADGQEYRNSVLTDITHIKQAQEELRLTIKRYQMIQNQTNDIIFEVDLTQKQITYSANWEKIFGYVPLAHLDDEQIKTASHIFPGDIPALLEAAGRVYAGVPYVEVEVRIAKAGGKYRWTRIRSTTQFHRSGKPIKAVGVFLDIDAEKRRTQELIKLVKKDALTQLYSKQAAIESIQHHLEQRAAQSHDAMMIIDLDNFKQINDSRGHMFGDAVLSKAAARLNTLFHPEDIVARFGGDEFLVYLRETADESLLHAKASQIIKEFRQLLPEEIQDCPLSCSIGISRCPEDGTDFQGLFQCCDQALYHAKLQGKSKAVLYNNATMSKIFGLTTEQLSAAGTQIESDSGENFQMNTIISQAFQKLYESENIEQAVHAILDMIGRRFNVSRVYIFEDSEDGTHSSNTFEWCGEGIRPAIDSLQNIPYHSLGENYINHFNENGIFYCQDISHLPEAQYALLRRQGIRSLLQCAVRDGGNFKGFVGFDDCLIQRIWTQEQIDALQFVSELLSTFLLKKRAQDRALTAVQDLRMILDNQNAWIYVIDPDTYQLRYINAKTQRTVPGIQLGTPCFEAFFHRTSPCQTCPAQNIHQTKNKTLEIYNPVLHLWTIADACLIHWGGQDACLLACHDITSHMPAGPAAT